MDERNSSSNRTGTNDSSFGHSYQVTFHTIILLIGLTISLHNALIIYLYKSSLSLRNFSNMLVVNLSFADLITGCLVLPMVVSSSAVSGRRDGHLVLYFLSNVLSDFSTLSVVLSLTAIITERYISVCRPYRYGVLAFRYYFRQSKRQRVLFIMWMTSFLYAVMPTAWSLREMIGIADKTDRFWMQKLNTSHSIVLLLLFFCTPAGVMFYAMVSMFIVTKNVSKWGTADQRVKVERKVIAIFSVMYVSFLALWTPMIIVRILIDVDGAHQILISQSTLEILFLLRCLVPLVNPGVYVWCREDFKLALNKVPIVQYILRKRQKKKHDIIENKPQLHPEVQPTEVQVQVLIYETSV